MNNNAAALERLIAELIDNAYSDGVDGTPCMSEQTARAKDALLRALTSQPSGEDISDRVDPDVAARCFAYELRDL